QARSGNVVARSSPRRGRVTARSEASRWPFDSGSDVQRQAKIVEVLLREWLDQRQIADLVAGLLDLRLAEDGSDHEQLARLLTHAGHAPAVSLQRGLFPPPPLHRQKVGKRDPALDAGVAHAAHLDGRQSQGSQATRHGTPDDEDPLTDVPGLQRAK